MCISTFTYPYIFLNVTCSFCIMFLVSVFSGLFFFCCCLNEKVWILSGSLSEAEHVVLVLWGTFRTLALAQDDLDSVFCSLVFFLHALLSCLSPPEKYKAERKAAGMVARFPRQLLTVQAVCPGVGGTLCPRMESGWNRRWSSGWACMDECGMCMVNAFALGSRIHYVASVSGKERLSFASNQ